MSEDEFNSLKRSLLGGVSARSVEQPEPATASAGSLDIQKQATYRVVLEGRVLPGFTREAACAAFTMKFKQSLEVAMRLLSGHDTIVKSNVDQATGMRLVSELRQRVKIT